MHPAGGWFFKRGLHLEEDLGLSMLFKLRGARKPPPDVLVVALDKSSSERLVPPVEPLADSAMALAPFPLPKVPVRVSQYWTFKSGAGDKATVPVVAFQIHVIEWYEKFVRLLEKAAPSLKESLPHGRNEVLKKKNWVNSWTDTTRRFSGRLKSTAASLSTSREIPCWRYGRPLNRNRP